MKRLRGKKSWFSVGPGEGVRVSGNRCFKWLGKRVNVKVVNVKVVNVKVANVKAADVNPRSWHQLGME